VTKRYDIPSDFFQGGRGLAADAGDTPNLKEFLQTLLDSVGGEYTCAADIAVGDVVYVSAASTVALADGNDSAKRPALGVVVYKKTSAATTCKVAFMGEVDVFTGLTAGATYYLSNTAGDITATAPTPNAQAVGVAKSATTLVLLPLGFSAPAMQAVDATLASGSVTIATGITVASTSEVIPVLIGAITGSTNFASVGELKTSRVAGGPGTGTVVIQAYGANGALDADAAGAIRVIILTPQ
jgi:hypothetical protein